MAHRGGEEFEVPEGIHPELLPSGSPELQPAQRLWPLANEAVADGMLFEEIEEIEGALIERCAQRLHDQSESIGGLTDHHWWPQAARRSKSSSSKNYSSAGFGITQYTKCYRVK